MNFILFVARLMKKTKDDHVNAYSAQAAFFIILSIIPFILLLVTSIQYIDSLNEADIQSAVQTVLPIQFHAIAISIIREVFQKSTAVIPVTAITALWSAARAVLSITNGLNSVYDVEESRNYIILRIRSALYTVLLIVVLIAALLLLVFGNQIHSFLSNHFPLIANITAGIISLRTFVSMIIMVAFFGFVFKYLPNRKAPLLTQIPGALFTAVGWSVFSYGFSIYLDYFNGMSNMYGSLTTIVLVMLWLYFCMYIMLVGGALNVELNDKVLQMSRERKVKREQKKMLRRQK